MEQKYYKVVGDTTYNGRLVKLGDVKPFPVKKDGTTGLENAACWSEVIKPVEKKPELKKSMFKKQPEKSMFKKQPEKKSQI